MTRRSCVRYLFPSSYHSPVLLDRRSVEQPRPDEQEEPEATYAAVSRTARCHQLFVRRELSVLDILFIPVPFTIYPRPTCYCIPRRVLLIIVNRMYNYMSG